MGPYPGLIETAGKALAAAECLPIFHIWLFTDHILKPILISRPARPRRRDIRRRRNVPRRLRLRLISAPF